LRDKKLLASFLTGYTRNADDAINVDRATYNIGRKMHMKLDGKSVAQYTRYGSEVQGTGSLITEKKHSEDQ